MNRYLDESQKRGKKPRCTKCGAAIGEATTTLAHLTDRICVNCTLGDEIVFALVKIRELIDKADDEGEWTLELRRTWGRTMGELLRTAADIPRHLFPATYEEIEALITGFKDSLKQEANAGVRTFLQGNISSLRTIQNKFHSAVAGEFGDEDSDIMEDQDESNFVLATKEKGNAKQGTTILTSPRSSNPDAKGARKTAKKNSTPNAEGANSASREGGLSLNDATRSLGFDNRYHYRRENKCKYCLSSKMKTRDCFFTLQLTNGKTKCTICKHDRKRCEPAEGPQTGEVIPNAGQIQRCALGTTPSTSSGPQASSATPKSSVLKRKATSPVQFSSPFKQRRTEDPSRQPHMQPDVGVVGPNHLITDASIVRQVSRLNTSFQSFNDVSLRQAESRREHDKQEIAFKEKKQAYEESKRVYEESKRTYEESERAYTARQEWLASRSNSAGTSLTEEATALLSSIPHDRASLDIAPELERFHLIFTEFERVQRQLSASNKFAGPQAQILLDLNECIRRITQ